MKSVNLSALMSGISPPSKCVHKGDNCVQRRVKGYKCIPWLLNTPQVAPIMDIWSDWESLMLIFALPKRAVATDEVALFRSVVACLRSLRSKRLALTEITEDSFCEDGDELHACKLSPYCEVVEDHDGVIKYFDEHVLWGGIWCFPCGKRLENRKSAVSCLDHLQVRFDKT